jgi:hypothetical protein
MLANLRNLVKKRENEIEAIAFIVGLALFKLFFPTRNIYFAIALLAAAALFKAMDTRLMTKREEFQDEDRGSNLTIDSFLLAAPLLLALVSLGLLFAYLILLVLNQI